MIDLIKIKYNYFNEMQNVVGKHRHLLGTKSRGEWTSSKNILHVSCLLTACKTRVSWVNSEIVRDNQCQCFCGVVYIYLIAFESLLNIWSLMLSWPRWEPSSHGGRRVVVLQRLICTTLSNLGQGKKAPTVSQVRVIRHSRTTADQDIVTQSHSHTPERPPRLRCQKY